MPEPRRRGDAPDYHAHQAIGSSRTPQARGCTASFFFSDNGLKPNPAGAGMHRQLFSFRRGATAEPRRRGDAPPWRWHGSQAKPRTPQARGCTARRQSGTTLDGPNPAGAGMHRWNMNYQQKKVTEPRRRGDAPRTRRTLASPSARTPQARGCTGNRRKSRGRGSPNPAGAGMHRH